MATLFVFLLISIYFSLFPSHRSHTTIFSRSLMEKYYFAIADYLKLFVKTEFFYNYGYSVCFIVIHNIWKPFLHLFICWFISIWKYIYMLPFPTCLFVSNLSRMYQLFAIWNSKTFLITWKRWSCVYVLHNNIQTLTWRKKIKLQTFLKFITIKSLRLLT